MIKKGVYACLGIFVFWVFLCLLQLWFGVFSAVLFVKITFTLAGFFVGLVGVLTTVVIVNQFAFEKKLKDNDFLDG